MPAVPRHLSSFVMSLLLVIFDHILHYVSNNFKQQKNQTIYMLDIWCCKQVVVVVEEIESNRTLKQNVELEDHMI